MRFDIELSLALALLMGVPPIDEPLGGLDCGSKSMGRLFTGIVAVRGALHNHEYCERARKIKIDRLRLVITTSTSSLIPRKHSHKLEHV